jgi:hypothetical protein
VKGRYTERRRQCLVYYGLVARVLAEDTFERGHIFLYSFRVVVWWLRWCIRW